MNKKYSVRFVSIVVLLALMILNPMLSATAQDGLGTEVNCNGLSEEDCQILKDSSVAMEGISSFTVPMMSASAELTVDGETLLAKMNGSGAFMLPPSLVALMSDVPQPFNSTNADALDAFYEQFDTDLVLQMLNELGLHLVLDELVLNVPDNTGIDIGLEMIFKDMALYARLPSPLGVEQWFGKPLELTDSDITELDAMLEEVVGELQTSEEEREAVAMLPEFIEDVQALSDLMATYIVTTRGDDVEVMGQNMMVFSTEFDLFGFLNDPDLAGLLLALIRNPELQELGMDTAELENINETQIQAVLLDIGVFMITNSLFSYELWIGADDLYVHKLVMNIMAQVDPALLGETEMGLIEGSMSLKMELAEHNTTTFDTIEVPTKFRNLDDTDDFLTGDASMIEQEITLGKTISDSFSDDDEQDVFALALEQDDTVTIDLVSKDYPYLEIYGPDGFLVEGVTGYGSDATSLTAEETGTYLLVVQGYWDSDYELTVQAAD